MKVEARLISSLEKVFCDEDLCAPVYNSASALRGELFSFQWAFRPDRGDKVPVCINVQTQADAAIRLYTVGHVPSLLPLYQDSDDNHLRRTPGLYPDVLNPCDGHAHMVSTQWRSLWIELEISRDARPGVWPIRLALTLGEDSNDVLAEAEFQLEIIEACLPEQTLINTNWFHCDCLAVYYNIPVWSEEHWRLIDAYMQNAVRYGINMILTPVITPPLDTARGGERPTAQLVDVTVTDGVYTFGFSRLNRYMDMAEKNGMRFFEIAHLFTQWGAEHAPKVMALVDGEEKRIFGWDTVSDSPEYTKFLRKLLTEMKEILKEKRRLERCYFHISDEPSSEKIATYRSAKESVQEVLAGCKIIDALSDYSFYQSGIVEHPIPANNHIEPFIQNGVTPLWTYYCCVQTVGVSNRTIAMPSARNRILGWQLYKFNVEGFLHWGYNFWFSRLSKEAVDPYIITDAGEEFPSGDAFIVYPGKDGQPVPSIRQIVFYEALQDMRALQLLGACIPHGELAERIDTLCGEPLRFDCYPRGAEKILSMREDINRHIKEACKNTPTC